MKKAESIAKNINILEDFCGKRDIAELTQDATMQYRMEAGLRKYVDSDVKIINYAVYSAKVIADNSALAYENAIWGMWDIDRYISLLMGEIPRLTDDNSYSLLKRPSCFREKRKEAL